MVFKPEFKILSKLIDQNRVIPPLLDEPGFLVLDLKGPEFELKAIRALVDSRSLWKPLNLK